MGKRSNGEGSIYQRKDGSWCAQMSGEVNPLTGKFKRKTVYGKTQKEVKEKLKILISQKDKGFVLESSKMTFGQWLETYLNDYKKKQLKESTFTRYQTSYKQLSSDLKKILLSKLKTNHLQKEYNQFTPASVMNIHKIVIQALDQACKENLIINNVAKNIVLPKYKPPKFNPLAIEAIRQLVSANINNDSFMPTYLALNTGLHKGEIYALKWEDIHLKEGYLEVKATIRSWTEKGKMFQKRVTETKSSLRKVPIPSPVLVRLKIYRKNQLEYKLKMGVFFIDQGLVFPNSTGGLMNNSTLLMNFKRQLKQAGLSNTIRFHDLRHPYVKPTLKNILRKIYFEKGLRIGHTFRSPFSHSDHKHNEKFI